MWLESQSCIGFNFPSWNTYAAIHTQTVFLVLLHEHTAFNKYYNVSALFQGNKMYKNFLSCGTCSLVGEETNNNSKHIK